MYLLRVNPLVFSSLNLISAVAFLVYGAACLLTPAMRQEFERFGVPQFRTLIGITQLLGSGALFGGFLIPGLGLAGASGLTTQMAAGLWVRRRIGDGWAASLQAALFLGINAALIMLYLNRL